MSLRLIAATLVIFGTILLLSILSLSQESVGHLSQNSSDLEIFGNVLKSIRDYVNHIFMVFILCASNMMFYILLIRSKLIPKWIAVWGLIGAILSIIASFLILFQVIEIITPEYLMLNIPTALLELILGVWLMAKGLDEKVLKDTKDNLH